MVPIWMKLEEVSETTQIAIPTLRRFCAQRRIHPSCGRKFGHVWRFRRSVIEEKGLVLQSTDGGERAEGM